MADASIDHVDELGDDPLPIGTVLSGDQFTITGQLGAGGFGITYRAKDNVLGRTVVIKECFPAEFCARDGKNAVARTKACADPMRSIVKMFMHEARSLAKLRHPNIVGVHRAFEENETAYMALDLIDGLDLFDILEASSEPLPPTEVKEILRQILNAVEQVHDIGLLHRDISPDNILIETSGTPMLIDFGAARADSTRHTRAVSSLLVVKDGYSPQEFYIAGREQTPSSDLYALAATFYHMLCGEPPTDSQTRMMEIASGRPDPCEPLVGRIEGYEDGFLQAIDMAMQIHPSDRLQSAAEWRDMISVASAPSAASPQAEAAPAPAELPRKLEISLSRLVEETNDEVRRTSQVHTEPEPEPEVTLRPTASRPKWIEEFNEEALASDGKPDAIQPVFETPHEQDASDPGAQVENAVDRARRERSQVQSKSKWVERAVAKQERKRSRRVNQSEVFKAASEAHISTTATRNPALREGYWEDGGAPSEGSKIKPIGVFLCLILSVYLVATTFEGGDANAKKEAVIPEANSIEMKGSIIR